MSLEERVIAIVAQNIEKKMPVKLESDLLVDLEVDSFSKIMIISALEDEFSITIDEAGFSDVTMVSDIVNKLRDSHPDLEPGKAE